MVILWASSLLLWPGFFSFWDRNLQQIKDIQQLAKEGASIEQILIQLGIAKTTV